MRLETRVALAALRRPPRRRYGANRDQAVDLHLPRTPAQHPVVVLLHGGHWRTGFGRVVTRPIALDLTRHGRAVLNVEYRRVGGGGGWPQTFDDVAAALALVADEPALDASRVALVGHSAGGHLALWAASDAWARHAPVRPTGVVALAPVTHLRRAGQAARDLLGGTVDDHPDRWDAADPMSLLPPPVPVLVVHPAADATVPLARSEEYADAARAAGGAVELVAPEGEVHRSPVDPASRSWTAARDWLLAR